MKWDFFFFAFEMNQISFVSPFTHLSQWPMFFFPLFFFLFPFSCPALLPLVRSCACRAWSAWWRAVRPVWGEPLWSVLCRTERLLWSWTCPRLMDRLWPPVWGTAVPLLLQTWVQNAPDTVEVFLHTARPCVWWQRSYHQVKSKREVDGLQVLWQNQLLYSRLTKVWMSYLACAPWRGGTAGKREMYIIAEWLSW